ncbi:Mbov_0395 family pilin-like conjugal transfer protein [Spiroplasma endosymbiont of Glossina fuscipes fuscipes]|uniref:Mbov_0395 family pilin-like conjugal transfer protein n=1 Tax=Spiroplasma endosymbiont of Glossina fuscipes fuscipes TaxID=2004463 RepID=UPI003CE8FE6A
MNTLFATSGVNDLFNKILGVLLPIFIGGAVVSAIIMIGVYAISGKFNADSSNRKETIKKVMWVLICLAIVVLASAIVLAFKDTIAPITS